MLERREVTRSLQSVPHLCLRLAARGFINHYQSNMSKSAVDLLADVLRYG